MTDRVRPAQQSTRTRRGTRAPVRTIPSVLALAAIVPVLLVAACDDGSTAPEETLARFDLDMPAAVTEGDAFELAITAVGSEGTRPFTDFSGEVRLAATDGEGNAATIEPASVTVTEGVGATEAVILDTSGDVSVEAGGGGAAGSGDIAVTVDTTRRLAGDPSSPAAAAIPDRTFEARPDDYSADHPELGGVYISFNTLLLVLELGTTVGEANELLTGMDAEIIGGLPGQAEAAPGVLVVRVPTESHETMDALLAELEADERVAHAVQDALLETTMLPGANSGASNNNWVWALEPGGGNWGLERIRAPAMWNLNDGVTRSTVTGVLDSGFDDAHEDVPYLSNETPGQETDHGTHVAGTIGATFDNGVGVDGVNPFADLVVRAGSWDGGSTVSETRTSFGQGFTLGVSQLIYGQPDIRVINMSLGMNWADAGINQNASFVAHGITAGQASVFRAMLWTVSLTHELPLIVVSAGNDSNSGFGVMSASWASPMTFAGLELDPPEPGGTNPIIVVESVRNDDGAAGGATRSGFSNTGGHISAPGSGVVSAIQGGYGSMSGTSMAAPHVTGLVSFLYALAPELTNAEVRELLVGNGVAVDGGAADRIDAYATALDIDRVRGDTRVRSILLDASADGAFDETDVADYLAAFDASYPEDPQSCSIPGASPADCPIYSRHDLNGDGVPGGESTGAFDLDIDGALGTTTFTAVDTEIGYDEATLTDLQILCYYAYSSVYQGDEGARDDALYDRCIDTGSEEPEDPELVLGIFPHPVCLAPGASHDLTAAVDGLDEFTVSWDVSAGSFEVLDGRTIRYTAPETMPTDGIVRVTARLVSDQEVRDAIELDVGDCSCVVRVAVEGVEARGTDMPSFDLTDDGTAVVDVFSYLESSGLVSFGFGQGFVSEPVPLGQVGTFNVVANGTQPDGVGTYTTYLDSNAEETGLRVRATLTENTSDVLAGTLSGEVWVWGQDRPGLFSMRFRIVADPAVSTDTDRTCIIE
jgi:subtilisin family serine protease